MTGGGFPHSEILGSKPCWRRIKALLAAPRGLSQPHTSFIGTVCQGIHHTPFTDNPHKAPATKASKHRTTDLRTHDHKNDQNKRTKP